MSRDAVSIKGTKHGLVVLLDSDHDYETVKISLTEKMETAKGFFKGAMFYLQQNNMEEIPAHQRAELESICIQHGLILNENVSITKETDAADPTLAPGPTPTTARPSSASTMSPGATLTTAPRSTPAPSVSSGPAPGASTRSSSSPTPAPDGESAAFAAPRAATAIPSISDPDKMAVLVRRSLRSGQKVSASGHVVVMGDVNHGAEIVSNGSVMILGHCRGVVHAGVQGDSNAIIVAWKMEPTILSIAGGRYAPGRQESLPAGCHLARWSGKEMIIEQYPKPEETST